MAATYEPIASQTLGSDATTVTFSSIPGTFTDLYLVIHEPTASGTNDGKLVFNSDTGGNYSRTILRGNGSSAFSARASNETALSFGGAVAGAIHQIQIMSYSNTSVYKTVLIANLNSVSATQTVQRQVSLWRSTAAITNIEVVSVTNGLKTGSTFSLYGIKAA